MIDEWREGRVSPRACLFSIDRCWAELNKRPGNTGNGRGQQKVELAKECSERRSDGRTCTRPASPPPHARKVRVRSAWPCLDRIVRDLFGSLRHRVAASPACCSGISASSVAPGGHTGSRRTIRRPVLPRCSTMASSLSDMTGSTGVSSPSFGENAIRISAESTSPLSTRHGIRITGIGARHRLECERCIRDVARDGRDHGYVEKRLGEPGTIWNGAIRWLEADHTDMGRRAPAGAACVRADRQRYKVRCDSRCRAARRTTGRQIPDRADAVLARTAARLSRPCRRIQTWRPCPQRQLPPFSIARRRWRHAVPQSRQKAGIPA